MSTQITEIKNAAGTGRDVFVTRYYGGDEHGVCVQLSNNLSCVQLSDNLRGNYIHFSAKDLKILIPILQKEVIDYGNTHRQKEQQVEVYCGDRIIIYDNNMKYPEEYIVAAITASMALLICLRNGNRWSDKSLSIKSNFYDKIIIPIEYFYNFPFKVKERE